MKLRSVLTSMLLASTFVVAAAPARADTWTVLTYLYADNSLERFAARNLEQMTRVGSSGTLKIAVQLNRGLQHSDATIPGIANFNGTKRLRIDPGAAVEMQDLGTIDNTQPQQMADFVQWGMQQFPADHYALILWDHGAAWQGCCEQEQSPGRDFTPLRDVSEGLRLGLPATKLDVIGFDACLMGSMEVAYAVQPYANLMVASAETEPGAGWDYESFLRAITTNPSIDGVGVGKSIADGYAALNASDDALTMSVVDLTRVPALTAAVEGLADQIAPSAALRDSWKPLATSRASAEKYARSGLGDPLSVIDLGNFLAGVGEQANYATSANAAVSALNAAVVYKVQGAGHPKHSGLNIYLPQKGASPEYAAVSYSSTRWSNFLVQYALGSGSDNEPPDLGDPDVEDPPEGGAAGASAGGATSSSDGTIPTIFGPINLKALSQADDINLADLFLSQQSADGSQRFLGSLPAATEGGRLRASFDGRWPHVSDGTSDGIAPFLELGSFSSREGGNRVMLAMVADLLRSSSNVSPGVVLFSYDPASGSAQVASAYTFDLARGFGQVDLAQENVQVRPWQLTVQAFGLPLPAPGTAVFNGATLVLHAKALAKGQYQLGFLVQDLAGNVAAKQTPVNVDVKDTAGGGAAGSANNASGGASNAASPSGTTTRVSCGVANTAETSGGVSAVVFFFAAIATKQRRRRVRRVDSGA